MQILISDFGEADKKVTLVGKLDFVGAQTIEQPMGTVSGLSCNIIVDMTGVDFLASNGIRHLLRASKAVAHTSRQLVLLSPNPFVTHVLEMAGVKDLMPIVRSEDEAIAAFGSARPLGG